MKKIALFNVFLVCIFFIFNFISCKNEIVFLEPNFVFLKWFEAVKKLNYKDYCECEAFPKEKVVFFEKYKHYYYSNIFIKNLDDYDEKNVKRDITGSRYNYQKIYFECKSVDRKTDILIQDIKGDIMFIKYLNGGKASKGWLMHNRTIIRSGSGKNK